jgi:hypothetical protein
MLLRIKCNRLAKLYVMEYINKHYLYKTMRITEKRANAVEEIRHKLGDRDHIPRQKHYDLIRSVCRRHGVKTRHIVMIIFGLNK